MKTKGFLLILFMFLVLTGCTNQNSQKPIVAKIDVRTLTDGQQYTFSIVQTKGSSTQTDEKTTYAGIFDLVVQDNKGAETSASHSISILTIKNYSLMIQ